ncbi:hypothetical protein AAHE18_19G148000 [Arachis hypogaea]
MRNQVPQARNILLGQPIHNVTYSSHQPPHPRSEIPFEDQLVKRKRKSTLQNGVLNAWLSFPNVKTTFQQTKNKRVRSYNLGLNRVRLACLTLQWIGGIFGFLFLGITTC